MPPVKLSEILFDPILYLPIIEDSPNLFKIDLSPVLGDEAVEALSV